MNSYITLLLGTDAMASKETQRKLIKTNQNRPKDLSEQVQRKTVYSRAPTFETKCPMQIIIFLGQDDRFYLSTKSCLEHHLSPISQSCCYSSRAEWHGARRYLFTVPSFQCWSYPCSNFSNYVMLERHRIRHITTKKSLRHKPKNRTASWLGSWINLCFPCCGKTHCALNCNT